ncbi:MAG: hypothetical protein ACMXX7_01470 [Candidatus Woesearchaeota archaeon]
MIKLDIKVAKIIDVLDHPNADKLYIEKLDVGGEEKQIVSGLKGNYEKDELLGKKILLVNNLKPAKLRGEKSEGMLLAVSEGEKVGVLETDLEVGTQIYFEEKPYEEQITITEFMGIKLEYDGELKANGISCNYPKNIKADKGLKGIVR